MTLSAMTRKERMRRVLQYEPVDHIPTQINYTAAYGKTMAAYFDMSPDQLPHYLGNHMLRVDIKHHVAREIWKNTLRIRKKAEIFSTLQSPKRTLF